MAGTMAGTMMEDGGVAFLFELAWCRDTVPSRSKLFGNETPHSAK